MAFNGDLYNWAEHLMENQPQLAEPKNRHLWIANRPFLQKYYKNRTFFLQILAHIKNMPYLCSDFTKQAVSLLFYLLQMLAFVG